MPTRTFRIFLSYASEDWKIALAIATSLREALGEFPEICLDKWVLEAGSEFKKQLEVKLEQTDVLIIVYTGVDKQSHSFTGWEVGYFEHITFTGSGRNVKRESGIFPSSHQREEGSDFMRPEH